MLDTILRVAQTLAPVLGGLGTLFLAYLYAKQYDILEVQTNLQAIEHEASLQADRIKGVEKDVGGSYFHIEISNVGKGVAQEIELRIEPQVDSSELYPQTTIHDLVRCRETDQESWVNTRSSYLNPDESQVLFESSAAMKMSDTAPPHDVSIFEHVTQELSRRGIHRMRIKLFVEYIEPNHEQQEDEILDYVIPIKGRTALREALLQGLPADAPNVENRIESNREEMETDSSNS